MLNQKRNSRDNWPELLPKRVTESPYMPEDFQYFNKIIGYPLHPKNKQPTPIFDFQIEYFKHWKKYHKLILVKSRKIGATETALRIILYNCFDHRDEKGILQRGRYIGHHVMIVAGNNQSVANKVLRRFKKLFNKGFIDMKGDKWTWENMVVEETQHSIEFWNGTTVQSYPANESVRGEADVICIFFTEPASINRQDDTPTYDALEPNVANIPDADFILEGTLKGPRGLFYELMETNEKQEEDGEEFEYKVLKLPYTVAMGTLLDEKYIERKKKDPTIDFDQEFNCKVSQRSGAAIPADIIKYEPKEDWNRIP